jgi:superfamily I DNA/RNA helicase/CRISPR/Cas system-associated exonuclease Cas4 (RecB family)
MAASRLRDLIALDSGKAAKKPRARSLSSFSFETLGEDSQIRLLSGAAQERLLRNLVDQAIERKAGAAWAIPKETLELQGFVQELRDLFAVIIENSLTQVDLMKLSQSYPTLKLQVALDLLPLYREQLGLQGLIDPAQLSVSAIESYVSGTYRYVLVDDSQNLTRGQLRLIEKIANSANCFLFGDPDATTLGFRGSSAGSFIELGRNLGFEEMVLESKNENQIDQLLSRISARIPVLLAGSHRKVPGGEDSQTGNLFSSIVEETDWLAQEIRKRHIEGVALDEIAVVARTRVQLEQLAKELSARKVPVRILGVQRALREQPMALAILDFLSVALADPTLEQIEQLLLSPLVRLNSIDLRQIRREIIPLRQQGRDQREALLELLASQKSLRILEPLSNALKKLRELDAPSCHQAVSIAWEMRQADAARGLDGEIDSALEIFAAAQRFDDRDEGGPADFAKALLESSIPEDSLAPISQRPAVTLATAAQLTSSYEVVAIPRLQEGIWPNLTPRNALLGASSLQAYLLGRVATPLVAARSELADEMRMFYRAVGAARSELLLSATVDETEQPSQFFALGRVELFETQVSDFDLRRLVGRLRRQLRDGDETAASQLAALALAQVPGAHPRSWQGLLPISDSQPLSRVGNRAAASKLEAFEKCPLHWFISTFATDTTSFQASLGILLHAALENADITRPSEYVERNWQEIEFDSSLTERKVRREAMVMAELVEKYLSESAELISAEESFQLQIGELTISGKIDRIEKTPDGELAVDLKTGKTAESKEKAAKNRQLAMYQLAIEQTAKPAGGKLVYVGGGKIQEREQAPMSDELRQEITQLAEAITSQLQSDVLSANLDDHCGKDDDCKLLLSGVITLG